MENKLEEDAIKTAAGRKQWSAPKLSKVDIAEVTENSISAGTDGKGGGETGATAS
ncbi:hypothetical protein [Rhodospirillum sp. A1_3_36]|uniref:hypothetical protein n=1 Tax=Rhodospirillum sp. A1_3_36 TaxID=3391666 RepID=UPI0039A54783